jgi:myosin heavy subunit
VASKSNYYKPWLVYSASQVTTLRLKSLCKVSDRSEISKEENGLRTSDPDGLQPSLSSESSSTSPRIITSTLDPPSQSASPPPAFTLEDRIHQLNHTLSMLQAERESLSGSLKGARKDAQKADASVRAEIDSLKRASDKYASVEHRARQKVLALQEAVKQTMAATAETHARVLETEASLPLVKKQKDEVEEEYKLLKEKEENILAEKIEVEKKKRKQIEVMQSELAGLGIKLEKLYSKQEKLTSGTIPDLEEELKRIGAKIEKVEKEPPPPDEAPEEADVGDDHDSYRTHSEVSGSNLIQQRGKHSPLRDQTQHPPIQRPIQIFRPTPQSQYPTVTNKSTSSTSTLSGLARPFEPSPTRQAQLQNTLQSSTIPAVTVKSDLNPTSTVFSPRLALAFQQMGTSGYHEISSRMQEAKHRISNDTGPNT